MDLAKQFYEEHFRGDEPHPQILPFNAEYTNKSPIDESDTKYQRDLAVSVSSHRGPLLYAFEGESLVRVSPEAPEPEEMDTLSNGKDTDDEYGDEYDWVDEKSMELINAIDLAATQAMAASESELASQVV